MHLLKPIAGENDCIQHPENKKAGDHSPTFHVRPYLDERS